MCHSIYVPRVAHSRHLHSSGIDASDLSLLCPLHVFLEAPARVAVGYAVAPNKQSYYNYHWLLGRQTECACCTCSRKHPQKSDKLALFTGQGHDLKPTVSIRVRGTVLYRVNTACMRTGFRMWCSLAVWSALGAIAERERSITQFYLTRKANLGSESIN